MAKKIPNMIDPNTFIQAGINPKTGLPIKLENTVSLKSDIKSQLEIIDRQDAVNRYKWFNLPDGLNQELIERILYYKGQGMFFYMPTNNKFYFLPYTLTGKGIDVYGRFIQVTPLPFNGNTSDEGKDKPWIQGLVRDVQYDIMLEEPDLNDMDNKCVILHDHTIGLSQTVLARSVTHDAVLDLMSNCLPYLNTALMNSTGVSGMRIQNENERQDVFNMSAAINNCALTGQKYVPIVSGVQLQELTSGTTGKAEEFLLAMQSLDNYRLSLFGLDNGGLFQKKSHMLEAEQKMNQGMSSLIYTDGLRQRQEFCNIVNSIWGLMIWCDVSEDVLGADTDGDGYAADSDDPQIPEQSTESEDMSNDTL